MAQKSMEGFLSPESKPRKSVKLSSNAPSPKLPAKRKASSSTEQAARGRKNAKGDLGDLASASELEEPEETPLQQLQKTMREAASWHLEADGDVVLYWMRMKDLRIKDNRALAHASNLAQTTGKTLVVVHVISPNDYRAHKRSARRIDFVLRNLAMIKTDLIKLNIPLHVMTVMPRKSLPTKLVDFAIELGVSHIFANIEYEVDELRQLTAVLLAGRSANIACTFMDDQSIVAAGKVLTKQGKPYSVFSPWQRNWASIVASKPGAHIDEEDFPAANPEAVLKMHKMRILFESEIPKAVEGFELDDAEQERMRRWWPAGTAAGEASLVKFVGEKVAKGKNDANIGPGPADEQEKAASANKKNLLASYGADRSRPDLDGSSRLSTYLAAGVISIRSCLRATLPFTNGKLKTDRDSSIGTWVIELSWRDFYQHVLAAWPRVCMGKSFQQKYDGVIWEYDQVKLQAWREGKTGFPLVDAGMRQIIQEGYMHNRVRMCVAQFLSKDLMMDWRLGELFFAQNLIDHDFGSNNGGWQWSSGTGTDPQPYFRIFNPFTQSEKSDPEGKYIRKYVPELASVPVRNIHDPHGTMSKAAFEKLGYPKPIADHASARKRAIARFKNIGSNVDE